MLKTHQFSAEDNIAVEALMKKTTTDAKLHKKLEVLQLRMDGYRNADTNLP